ncbi:hypothetical protein [Nocardia gipuzkoensis]
MKLAGYLAVLTPWFFADAPAAGIEASVPPSGLVGADSSPLGVVGEGPWCPATRSRRR